MKRVFISIAVLLVSLPMVFSQSTYSTYFLNEWSKRSTLNAAFAPEYGYFTLPGLSSLELNLSTNTGLKNYVFEQDGKRMHFLDKNLSAANTQLFLSSLNTNNYINQNLNLSLFSFGFYTSRMSFWSFDISMKQNLYVNMPLGLFKLMKVGMARSTGNTFDLSNLSVEQSDIAQVTLGYSRNLGSKLRIGVNAKLLAGLSSARFNYSKFDVLLDKDIYKVDAVGESQLINNVVTFDKDADNYYDFSKSNTEVSGLSKPAGTGYAFDFGLTYKPFKRLTIAAGVNDIGSIKWKSSYITRGKASSNVSFDGFENIDVENVDVQSQIDQVTDDAKKLIKFKEDLTQSGDLKETLPYTVNASAELGLFGNDKHDILFGVLYQKYNSTHIKTENVIGAVTLKPLSWLTLSGTYNISNKDYKQYGLALNFSPRWINLYIASDFVNVKVNKQYVPIDKVNANISLGGSFVIGRPRDTDKDGVVNRRDRCPDTPLGVKVDKHGCPLDSDKDGVPDYLDKCPNTVAEAAGKVDSVGCPLDTDHDGIADYLDKCPDTPAEAKVDSVGCPLDTDHDGIADYLDKCPDTPAGIKVDSVGCPLDEDKDGVADYQDLCPNTPFEAHGKVDKNGCPLDSDLDGVPDYLDLCPNTPAEARSMVDKNGCTSDKDSDGVPDYLDKCPDTPIAARGMVDEKGCPRDADGDGVPDYLDKCPTIVGSTTNNGCPEIKSSLRTLFRKAMSGVQFETGKSIIKDNSFAILDQIVKVLVENPSYLIDVRGHTDNVGNPQTNLELSKNRANAIRDYFVSKNIDARRITANGFGDTQPIANNKTADGRSQNRRVEFVITFEEVK